MKMTKGPDRLTLDMNDEEALLFEDLITLYLQAFTLRDDGITRVPISEYTDTDRMAFAVETSLATVLSHLHIPLVDPNLPQAVPHVSAIETDMSNVIRFPGRKK